MAIQFRYRLLMVDDSAAMREFGAILFSLHNYDVSMTGNGIEALRTLRRIHPHVVIADLQMPLIDGLQFLRIVRSCFPEIGVIATSGAFEGDGTPAGVVADAFLGKRTYLLPELMNRAGDLATRFPLRSRHGENGNR